MKDNYGCFGRADISFLKNRKFTTIWSFAFQNAKKETLELGRQINLSEDGSRYEYGLCAPTVRTMRTPSVDYSHYKRRLCTREMN